MPESIKLTDKQLELAVQIRDYHFERAEVMGVDLPLALLAIVVVRGIFAFVVRHNGRMLRNEQAPYPGYFRQCIGVGKN